MRSKVFKIVVAILLVMTLTMVNFIYVGAGIVSYAAEDISTNHRNVEFTTELKNENTLTLQINVKNEGYFNGEVTLENSNFRLKSSQSEYVNKVEDNKISLNQINAGTVAQIDVEIEQIKDDNLDASLLDKTSTINLTGIYRDSTEKDINIKASRELKLEYAETNDENNVENGMEVITNKVTTVNGEEKRVVQVSMNLGLKDNNYPIKEIDANFTISGEDPEVVTKSNLNTMTSFNSEYKNGNLQMVLTNNPNEENKILWKKQGNENVILTLIYNKDVDLNGVKLPVEETVKLYNDKEITVSNTVELNNEEKDNLVQVSVNNTESTIYKGKLNANLDRSFETKTSVAVNLSNAEDYISIKENASNYNLSDGNTVGANVVYNRTVIEKSAFDKILGQNGSIQILNEQGVTLANINSASQVDENGNVVVDYTGREPKAIEIKTSEPVAEGNIVFTHTKTIKPSNANIINSAIELVASVSIDHGNGIVGEQESKIAMQDSKTEASLEINKDTLSTVVDNNVEIRALLKSNQEQYNLYENPTIRFDLPESVENVTINSVDLLYETELKITNYVAQGRTILVQLSGKQTYYKEQGVEGALLVLNITAKVNRKAATQDSKVVMTYQNRQEVGTAESAIKVIAPTDMTLVQSINDLGVDTIGQEEETQVSLQRGTNSKNLTTGIEVINNNENTVENVKVLGDFPTKNAENNIDTNIINGLNVSGVDGAKVYYSENENATDDLQDGNNGWQESITDGTQVKKYLIEVPQMETQTSMEASYVTEVPASLEYNQEASQGYSVTYQNSVTKASNQMNATTIKMETGVGPILETKISASVGGSEKTTVKNGEVIKYKIEVSNVGSEDISNVTVKGNVPEGTTLVVPEDNYEYTGASYYKELDSRTYEDTIDTLKVGEVATREYEVRVNSGVAEGTKLVNTSEIKYGDVTKTSEENTLTTTNGNLRISVKRVTDRNVNLYETGTVQYFAIIENISDETQNDIKVKTNLQDGLEVTRLSLTTNMESEEVSDDDISQTAESVETREVTEDELTQNTSESTSSTEQIEYSDEIDIGSLGPGENKVLSYDLKINKLDSANGINFSVTVNDKDEEYNSNVATDNIRKADISLSMVASPENNYVKAGDTIVYTINVKNSGTQPIESLILKDEIPSSLTVNKVEVDGKEVTDLKERNNIQISIDLSAGSEMTIKIEAVVNYSEGRIEAEPLTNVAHVELLGETIATTPEITHIIEANENAQPGTGTDTDNPNGDNNVGNNDVATGNRIITGVAWFDENANGQKDDGEQLMSGVTVQLYNTETNNLVKKEDGSILQATTNENGVYALDHVGNGKYIAIFKYDSAYTLTKYKAQGVSENNNSDAMMNELTIDGTKQSVASTDIIEVNNENVSDINVGLIKLQNFDLQLEKFVNRVVIQDSSGSTVREYGDETLARAELDAKRVNGATVVIEYKIRVSNVGEVDGYVRSIVDYMPSDLKFNSELNKDWYQTSDGLYNSSLANDKIAPGETREVTLTLTKDMTENNVGLINNTAEIEEDYNELGLQDSNSTPGNRVNGENDYGSADLILGIRTGGGIYVGITIAIVAVLGVIAFIIIRRKNKNNEEI